jgi:hypothetical protein
VEVDGDTVVERGCVGLDGFVESGGKELAEAAAYVVFVKRRAFSLGKMVWERSEAIGGYTIKGDTANGPSLPTSEGGGMGGIDGRQSGVA